MDSKKYFLKFVRNVRNVLIVPLQVWYNHNARVQTGVSALVFLFSQGGAEGMAKVWAKPFYNSDAWKYLRRSVLLRDHYTCEVCGGYATEVHHEIELTEANVNDPAVALNPKLLHSLCGDCHKEITRRHSRRGGPDCDAGYGFDADGRLTPRG